MPPLEFRAELNLACLSGSSITAYAQDEGYWHLFVSLRYAPDAAFVFTTEERRVAARFEVFPISVAREEGGRRVWHELDCPFLVASAAPLWRTEWIEAGAVGPTLGSDPNTQYAGRGPSPLAALSTARVLAGVLLEATSGKSIIISASGSAPLNVEIALTREAVVKTLLGFENVSSNPSIERTS